MDLALMLTLAAAALLVAVGVLAVVLAGRRRLRAELATAQARLEDLARRVESLTRAEPAAPAPVVNDDREYIITTVGDSAVTSVAPAEPLTAGQFASVALGESLVRVFSFGYGVRRALSAENRNRIAFEMRREVRRSRKQRRRDVKEARHRLRAVGEDAA